LPVSVEGSHHANDVIDKIRHAVECAAADRTGEHLVACRVELTGRSELHDYILCAREQLYVEARAAALGLGDEAVWIEKLVVNTEAATRAADLRQGIPDGLPVIIGAAADDPNLCNQLQADIGELVRKLPHEIRADLEDGILKAAIQGDYAKVLQDASKLLAAKLSGEGA